MHWYSRYADFTEDRDAEIPTRLVGADVDEPFAATFVK